ncbi:TPA: hypothetical protein QHC28_000902 [Aeromonas veronii bv. veronii]|nr:hypothetical protein [Aeromonas veronii bv. veronii]
MKHELKIKPEFLADATRQCGAMAELLRDIHEHIGASIPQTISEHYQGCDLLDRIDAVLAGQVPYHPEQPLDMVQEGWKLVPVNPTSEMISAGNAALAYDCCSGTADEAWPAMLAAAPKHQGGEPCALESRSSSKD